jgi:protein TonB
MFEDATFHSSGILPNQTPKWMLLTFAVNLTAVTALIVLPLIYPGALPTHIFQSILYTPPPEPIAVKQQILMQPATQSIQPIANQLNVRTLIPRPAPIDPTAPPLGDIADLSPINDGRPGGTGTSTIIFTRSTPVVVKPASTSTHPMTVSTGVSEGMILSKTNPTYPVIARTTGTSGTVVLAATISTTGRIENLNVVSGPPMLRQAAIDAVKTWRYRPYLLNNQPVEVETTINIAFTLSSR